MKLYKNERDLLKNDNGVYASIKFNKLYEVFKNVRNKTKATEN